MNGPKRHQKSSLVSITPKILEASKGDLFFLPTFTQFNFSCTPPLMQKTLRNPLTLHTWPPLSRFLRSSPSTHPHVSERWSKNFFGKLSPKRWQGWFSPNACFLLPQTVDALWCVPILVSMSTQEHTGISDFITPVSTSMSGSFFSDKKKKKNHTCLSK